MFYIYASINRQDHTRLRCCFQHPRTYKSERHGIFMARISVLPRVPDHGVSFLYLTPETSSQQSHGSDCKKRLEHLTVRPANAWLGHCLGSHPHVSTPSLKISPVLQRWEHFSASSNGQSIPEQWWYSACGTNETSSPFEWGCGLALRVLLMYWLALPLSDSDISRDHSTLGSTTFW